MSARDEKKMTDNEKSSDGSIDVDVSESESTSAAGSTKSEKSESAQLEGLQKESSKKSEKQHKKGEKEKNEEIKTNKRDNEETNDQNQSTNSKEASEKDNKSQPSKSEITKEREIHTNENNELKDEESSHDSSYEYEEEDEREEASREDSLDLYKTGKLNDLTELPPLKATEKFQCRAIAASLVCSINMFRTSKKLDLIDEDRQLARIAFKHSRKMAFHTIPFNTQNISAQLKGQPYVFYDAFVSRYETYDHAFTDLVNEWTTNKVIVDAITSKFNVVGIGVCFSQSGTAYFTLLLASRSLIGYSQFSGNELYSIAMANCVVSSLNKLRQEHKMPPMRLDLLLCSIAYKLFQMKREEITNKFVKSKLEPCPNALVAFGTVSQDSTPTQVVKEWLQQYGSTTAVLGDFNRIGFGFSVIDGQLHSIRIMMRSLHAALIDGSDHLVDNDVLAKHVAEAMNHFREQHSLDPLNLDEDLFNIAQAHSEYMANGAEGESPIESAEYVSQIEPRYLSVDISHTTCIELSRAPKAIMKKWRNNMDCVSVLLNRVDDIGIGLCFTDDYICHVTVIVASVGNESEIVNKIVNL